MDGRELAVDPGLPEARLGIVPLLWANDDLPDLTPPITAAAMLDEVARLGFAGLQLSRVLPRGDDLARELRRRGLRIAEVYATLPCTAEGPSREARDQGRAKIRDAVEVDADVLILSYHLSPGRVEHAGRAAGSGVARLSAEGFRRAVEVLHALAEEAKRSGRATVVYHPHVGTFVETPEEVDRLIRGTDPALLGLCLDTGHYTLGGGDAPDAIRRYADRLAHVHLKDVSPSAMASLRADPRMTFLDALRARIFTELGNGALDVLGVARALVQIGYRGWLMAEQDTTWRPPAESAAIARRVWGLAVREAARHAAVPS